ncbi:MAG: 5-formyltetrahydrofolate cyclo-ligase [Cyanobacteriota bacterium]|nr:5-formyltetrahydrofolate cyclo-ligase [Cyanobacteriota bacterium]MDY6365025.1 5-formyltetrahydrofolate cyclo-ligase [Cyanobacteriota bacterium]MDY6382339.1 5-formyltetrahydrofolate cyclo-ligase [Cyanobacteriota bacterium]
MDNKIDLRIEAKKLRKKLPMKEISSEIVKLLRKNKIYLNAKNVMLFYPTKFEIDLRELLNDDKNFYLPRVNGDNLEVCPFSSNTPLIKSSLGINEPATIQIDPKILDVVIVPALMTDKNGYRLGYGGGFYDRFIKNNNFTTICPIPKELTVDSLPVEEFDEKIDYIISF